MDVLIHVVDLYAHFLRVVECDDHRAQPEAAVPELSDFLSGIYQNAALYDISGSILTSLKIPSFVECRI